MFLCLLTISEKAFSFSLMVRIVSLLDAKKAKKLHRKQFFSKILEFFFHVLYDDVLGASPAEAIVLCPASATAATIL